MEKQLSEDERKQIFAADTAGGIDCDCALHGGIDDVIDFQFLSNNAQRLIQVVARHAGVDRPGRVVATGR